jgi:hypothetical protein
MLGSGKTCNTNQSLALEYLKYAGVNLVLMDSYFNTTDFGPDPVKTTTNLHFYTMNPNMNLNYFFKV